MIFVRKLLWDAWNVAHIARHRVVPEEVEQVCHDAPFTSETYRGRLRVIGATPEGRILTIILAPSGKSEIYYPVTARPADRKERAVYIQSSTE